MKKMLKERIIGYFQPPVTHTEPKKRFLLRQRKGLKHRTENLVSPDLIHNIGQNPGRAQYLRQWLNQRKYLCCMIIRYHNRPPMDVCKRLQRTYSETVQKYETAYQIPLPGRIALRRTGLSYTKILRIARKISPTSTIRISPKLTSSPERM